MVVEKVSPLADNLVDSLAGSLAATTDDLWAVRSAATWVESRVERSAVTMADDSDKPMVGTLAVELAAAMVVMMGMTTVVSKDVR